MKRAIVWLFVLLAVAVGLAYAAGEHGMVSLFWAPYRFDVSLRALLLLLLALFVLLHLTLRILSGLWALPRRFRQRRQSKHAQAQRECDERLLEALTAAQSGRWARARRAAGAALARTKALPDEDTAALRYAATLIAAEGAHAMRDTKARDGLLQGLLKPAGDAAPGVREGALLRAAQWALEADNADGALAHLDALPRAAARRVDARRLRLYALQMAGRDADAAPVERQLARHGLLDATAQAEALPPPMLKPTPERNTS